MFLFTTLVLYFLVADVTLVQVGLHAWPYIICTLCKLMYSSVDYNPIHDINDVPNTINSSVI